MSKMIFPSLKAAGLTLTLLPAVLVFLGVLSFEAHKDWMLFGGILWFGAVLLQERMEQKGRSH